jgi:hypothetical protein
MNRHPFRWDALAFGLFFLAVLGQWAVWDRDLLGPDELAYVAAAVLIVLGVLGIVGTVISARPNRRKAPFTPAPTIATEAAPDEDDLVEDDPLATLTDIEPTDNTTTENTSTRGGDPS